MEAFEQTPQVGEVHGSARLAMRHTIYLLVTDYGEG